MATVEEVKKLAALARLEIKEDELKTFTRELDAILAYVGQLESLDISIEPGRTKQPLRNVMREDGEPHESGKYTEAIAKQFPAREGDALSVKQIITHD
jgi:aspartyl-tRNA(Asn)/glutamyl-tRNA(Gln) amidotransferase subunit C